MGVVHTVSTVAAGLFAGLMMTLVLLLQRQWDALEGVELAVSLRRFLLVAKGDPFVTVLTVVPVVGPTVLALDAARGGATGEALLLALAGGTFLVGCVGVTVLLNLPLYRTVTGWSTQTEPEGLREARRRFFRLNVVRLVSASVTFVVLAAV